MNTFLKLWWLEIFGKSKSPREFRFTPEIAGHVKYTPMYNIIVKTNAQKCLKRRVEILYRRGGGVEIQKQ